MPQASRHGDFRILYRRFSSCMQQMMSFPSGPSCKIRTWTSARRVRTLRDTNALHSQIFQGHPLVPPTGPQLRLATAIAPKHQKKNCTTSRTTGLRILVVWGSVERVSRSWCQTTSANIDRTTLLSSGSKLDRTSRSSGTIYKSTGSSTVTKWI